MMKQAAAVWSQLSVKFQTKPRVPTNLWMWSTTVYTTLTPPSRSLYHIAIKYRFKKKMNLFDE